MAHPRSQGSLPSAEELSRDLEQWADKLDQADLSPAERATVRDQLGILAGRIPWVPSQQQRDHLQKQLDDVWHKAGGSA